MKNNPGVIALLAFIGLFCVGYGLYTVFSQQGGQAATTTGTGSLADPSGENVTRVAVPANILWYDTGVKLSAGQSFSVHSEGTWKWDTTPGHESGGEGFGSFSGLLVPNAPLASLVAKVGNHTFGVSNNYSGKAPESGELLLSCNDLPNGFSDNRGSLDVTIKVTQSSAGPATSGGARAFTVDARRMWTNTSIQLKPGDTLTIDATGEVNIGSPGDAADKWVGPDGWGNIPQFNGSNGQPHRYIYATGDSAGCLIAKVGNGKPFSIGKHDRLTVDNGGILYLGVNDVISDASGRILDNATAESMMFSNNRGSFNVRVEVK